MVVSMRSRTASARASDSSKFDGKRKLWIGWLSVWPITDKVPGNEVSAVRKALVAAADIMKQHGVSTHTPSIDTVLMLFGRETVLRRLEKAAG